MLRTVLFLTFVALAAAQRVPGRYIVQLKTEPAAAITAAREDPLQRRRFRCPGASRTTQRRA